MTRPDVHLRGLPPARVITAEADVLPDEGEVHGRKLRQAGVDVTITRCEGVFHDFMMLNALAQTNATRDAFAQWARALTAALDRWAVGSSLAVTSQRRRTKPSIPPLACGGIVSSCLGNDGG